MQTREQKEAETERAVLDARVLPGRPANVAERHVAGQGHGRFFPVRARRTLLLDRVLYVAVQSQVHDLQSQQRAAGECALVCIRRDAGANARRSDSRRRRRAAPGEKCVVVRWRFFLVRRDGRGPGPASSREQSVDAGEKSNAIPNMRCDVLGMTVSFLIPYKRTRLDLFFAKGLKH